MSIHKVNTPAGKAKRTMLVLAMIVGAVIVGPQAFADGTDEPVMADTYTVIQGETLWSIANAITAPGDSVSDAVHQIKDLNGINSGDLRAGEQILVPSLTS